MAPGERKGWKEKKKSHPGSCHGAACGVCLDAAGGRRSFQCEKMGPGRWFTAPGPRCFIPQPLASQLAWPAEETSRQVSPKPLSSDSTIPEVAQSEQGSSRVCADGAPWGYTSCSFGPESQNELVLLVLLGVSCLRYTRRATCDIIIPCQRCFHTNIVYYDLRNNINKTFRYRRLI